MERPFADRRLLGPLFELNALNMSASGTPRPTDNDKAIYFFTPTEMSPSSSQLDSILSKIAELTGKRPTGEVVQGGIMFKASDGNRGKIELPHVVLDVAEGVTDNVVGKEAKSTLIANNPGGSTLQGCLQPISGTISDSAHDKIDTDVKLVANTTVDSQQVEQRHYLNTEVTSFNHNVLDVMELATRRAATENITKESGHAALIRDSTL